MSRCTGSPARVGLRPLPPHRHRAWFVSDQRTIVVEDFFAPTSEAYLGLLRFLFGLDLVDRVVVLDAPLDDPLPWLLLDRRAARVTAVHDETWLRVVDVTALAARRYAGDGAVTIAVNDPVLPANSLTSLSPGTARDDGHAPELHVGIEGLGAVLLGGATWRSLPSRDWPTPTIQRRSLWPTLFAVTEAPYAGIFF